MKNYCNACNAELIDVVFYSNLFQNPTLEVCGQFTKEQAPEILCSNCADKLSEILENCNYNCLNCNACRVWKLNSKSCVNLQNQLGLIDDKELAKLEFIKFWQLVRNDFSITHAVQQIKNDIVEARRI